MGIVVIIVSMLVVVGSFMWMRPSPRDQYLSKIRSKALMTGFRIGSMKVPDTSEEGRISEIKRIVTTYAKNLEVIKGRSLGYTVIRTSGEAGIYLPDGWQWHEREDMPQALMEQAALLVKPLPLSITLITVSDSQAALSWDEKDPQVTFDTLSQILSHAASLVNRKIQGE
ncbi:hypothetical protein QWZ13_10780 [Reinekea marina]|uniref:Uncharacterized protein n=1 Tax=Reinekea marina TaxID=1310421 RepID=A0ABV7WMZ1_9GAMM|nr:hypothetical protein [Reinekea marina]MDN3649396.1 hypothetical protein [Reinekea marina]